MSRGKVSGVDPRQCWSRPRGLHSLAHQIPGLSRQAHSPGHQDLESICRKQGCALCLQMWDESTVKTTPQAFLLWDKRPIFLQLLKEKGGDKSLRISAKWIWILYKLCGWRQRLAGNICSYWTLRPSCSWSPGHRRLTLFLVMQPFWRDSQPSICKPTMQPWNISFVVTSLKMMGFEYQ